MPQTAGGATSSSPRKSFSDRPLVTATAYSEDDLFSYQLDSKSSRRLCQESLQENARSGHIGLPQLEAFGDNDVIVRATSCSSQVGVRSCRGQGHCGLYRRDPRWVPRKLLQGLLRADSRQDCQCTALRCPMLGQNPRQAGSGPMTSSPADLPLLMLPCCAGLLCRLPHRY